MKTWKQCIDIKGVAEKNQNKAKNCRSGRHNTQWKEEKKVKKGFTHHCLATGLQSYVQVGNKSPT